MNKISDQEGNWRLRRTAPPQRLGTTRHRQGRWIGKMTLAAGLAVGALASSAAAEPAGLAPYRAAYDLKLENAKAHSGLSSIDGRLVIVFAGSSCDGYTQNTRLLSTIASRRGKVNLLDSSTTSWESGDGADYRFIYRRKLNKRLKEHFNGQAGFETEGGAGMARFEQPKGKTFALSPGVMFPNTHMKVLLKAAADGESFQRSIVFDGTEGPGVSLITTVISQKIAPGAKPVAEGIAGARKLDKLTSWIMTLSYFPLGKKPKGKQKTGEQERDHAMRFRLFENGVAGDITLIFKGFRMSGKLSSLEIQAVPECD